MTRQQSVPGVQLEQDLKMINGDIVQRHVSENVELSVSNGAYVTKLYRYLYFCFLCLWAATDKWIKNLATGVYYQLNVQSVLTWSQADTSCKQQGASLLSISDPHQQAFVSGRIPPGVINTKGKKLLLNRAYIMTLNIKYIRKRWKIVLVQYLLSLFDISCHFKRRMHGYFSFIYSIYFDGLNTFWY